MKHKKDDEWFEVSDDMWKDPKEMRPKLRLLADHNIPLKMVQELRKVSIDVQTAADVGKASVKDPELFVYARKIGRVLLTADEGFWSDRTHRLHKGAGVIIVSVNARDVHRSLLNLA